MKIVASREALLELVERMMFDSHPAVVNEVPPEGIVDVNPSVSDENGEETCSSSVPTNKSELSDEVGKLIGAVDDKDAGEVYGKIKMALENKNKGGMMNRREEKILRARIRKAINEISPRSLPPGLPGGASAYGESDADDLDRSTSKRDTKAEDPYRELADVTGLSVSGLKKMQLRLINPLEFGTANNETVNTGEKPNLANFIWWWAWPENGVREWLFGLSYLL